jgi:Zn-dependent protease with chaperone function
MKRSIKFKERILGTLDTLTVAGILFLHLFVLFLIIIIMDAAFAPGDDVAASIITAVIFLSPLVIIFFYLSRILFSIFFQKDDKLDGLIISKKEFPQLYETINEIRIQCKCPKIHVLALDYSNNAYIREGSRFGLAQWKKRYLVIGVPLLLLLNERELKGVIAHECGHLSRLHSRSTQRISWKMKGLKKYLDKLSKKRKYNSVIGRVVKKYVINLNNLYYQLSKNHELEADIVAAKVVSKQTLINALIKMEFYDGIFSGYFWRTITEFNKNDEKVIEDIYFMLERAMKGNLEIPEEVFKNFLEGIRNYNSLPGSTHPSIAERAKSLGAVIPSLEGKFNGDLISIFKDYYESAIRTLFKNEAENILRNMSIKWTKLSTERWAEYFKYITGLKTSLKDLEAAEKEKGLEGRQWLDKGFIIEELEGSDAALEVFREAVKADNQSLPAKFHMARILLLKGEGEGVDIFKAIMEEDVQLIPKCCFHLVNYYLYNNRTEAINFYNYAVNFMNTNEEAADERATLYLKDELLPHDLSVITLEKIKNELKEYKDIKKAYIVMKKLNLTKDFPLYIIAVKYRRFVSKKKLKSIVNEILKALNNEEILPWDFKIVPLNRKNINIEYGADSILGSRII